MNQTKMSDYFNESFGFLILFIFIVGFVSDLLINAGTRIKFPYRSPWFAQGLVPYYKSVGWFIGAILGGIACVVALVFAQLLLKLKESF
jgi:hypothetical protein